MRVVLSADGARFELHLVLGERAGLVGEDVLHLPEVLGNVEGAALDPFVRGLVVERQVLVDEVHLQQLDDLQRHIQRQRDHRLKQHEVGSVGLLANFACLFNYDILITEQVLT